MSNKTTTTNNKFPDKPITIIVGFSVGGGSDLLARAMEKVAPKYLGQSLVVLNKPGGAGANGWNELAGSSPDGYTLAIVTPELLLLPLYGETKYHYPTALEPIAQISTLPYVMIVSADQPWQNVQEVIEYAKQHPGKLKFGHSGIGSMPHIIGETFKKVADIDVEQVPFRSGNETLIALLGGNIDIAIMNTLTPREHIKTGTVKALAVPKQQRLSDPTLAHIPTFKEQGLAIVFDSWYGVAASKDLPPEIAARLAEGFNAMVSDPELKNNMDALGVELKYLGPKEFQNKWLEDNVKLTNIIQETGILNLIKEQKK
ncbi:tripartite tricarboxylate transporter substrate binding protein [Pelosinus baikalensis]|uniref:Tripartite tricarboxylate transporter substrate binding protein n=1 Tax=Pelosinus baikalensis TaxID=2892015 RepID=A0ABS8HT53_9FIRM|nr:tripartite tricarboxylate transporter substrate binding protein [Pelosinus baikalensis]MCC5466348.1 tripartite tricarboxylate transporter substrate binding protein [Pelosinus baikalensis]